MQWLLTRGRIPYLIALAAIVAGFATQAARLDIEKTNASLTAQNSAHLADYAHFKQLFGSDEDLLLAVHDPQLLQLQSQRWLAELTQRVAQLDGVRRVFSLSNAKELVPGVEGAVEATLVPPFDSPDFAERLRTGLDRNPDFSGWLVSADRQTAGLLIETEERPGDQEYQARLIAALRAEMSAQKTSSSQGPKPGSERSLHLTGIAVQKHDVSAFIERDQNLLMPLALLTLAALLAVFFRRWLGVALPLAVTGVTVVCTLGAYHLAGLKLNAITALLPPILMVLSVAVSIHLIQGWLQASQLLTDPVARVRHVARELFFPCFFCSLTTALGFGSLLVGDMPAVRQFGIFAAVGVIVSFVVGMTLVPIGLTYLSPPHSRFEIPQHRWMQALLEWAADVAVRSPWLVLAIFAAVTLLSLFGLPMLRNNTDLVRFMKSDAPLYRDTMFIDTHLTGANAIEVMVERRDGTPLSSLQDMQRLAAFEAAVRRQPQVTTVTTILAVLRQLQRAESGSGRLELPDNERDMGYLFDLVQAAPDHALIDKLIAPDFKTARLSVRFHAVGTAVAAPMVEAIIDEGKGIFGGDYTLTPTGAFYYVALDSNRLVHDQVSSFGLGMLTVFLAIALLFRAFEPTVVSVIPNVAPILWTGGLMGFLGIDLSTGTAMIASAVIGLVVDDTIHYLEHFYRSRPDNPAAAVRATTTGIGAALVMNNLVLVLGFWVGAFGSFKPTIYFSVLTGFTMITAMLCDLFVTPASLFVLHRRRPGAASTGSA